MEPPSYSPPPPPPGQPYGQPVPPPTGQPYGQPSYGQPSYGQPAYPAPAEAPAYGPPAGYDGSGYSQPGYTEPAGYAYSAPPSGYGAVDTAIPPAPPRKSRAGLWTILVVVAVIVIAAVVVVIVKPSPLFKKVLDRKAVEQTIEQQSKGGSGDFTGVSCPANEEIKSGNTFQCTAAGGKKINVTINSKDGQYTWTPAG